MKSETIKTAAVLLFLLVLPVTGCAADDEHRGRKHGPPPEAIEACVNKSAGDGVTFKGRRGESLEATCQEVDGQLIAVPEGKKRGGKKRD